MSTLLCLLWTGAMLLERAACDMTGPAAVGNSMGQNGDCPGERLAVFDVGIKVGDLYDGTKQMTVPGLSLWSAEQLEKHTETNSSVDTNYEMLESNEILDKADFLDVSASLTLGMLYNLVHISGSGEFMTSHKRSHLEASVAARATTRTHYKQLRSGAYYNISYPRLASAKYATHIVTRVEYGANLVMQFTKSATTEQDSFKLQGSLGAALGNCLGKIQAHLNVTFNQTTIRLMNQTHVQIYGQIKLERVPANMVEAVQLVQKLPAQMYDMEKTVPRFATVLPIRCLPEQTERRMLIEIENTIIDNLIARMQSHVDTQLEIEYLTRQPNHAMFHGIKTGVDDYATSCNYAHYVFSLELAGLLPEVRAGNRSSSALTDLLMAYPNWETLKFTERRKSEFTVVQNRIAHMQAVLQTARENETIYKTREELLVQQLSTLAPRTKPMLVLKLDARTTRVTCGMHCGKADIDVHKCKQCLQDASMSWMNQPPKRASFLDVADTFVRLLQLNKADKDKIIVVSEANEDDVSEAQMPYAKIELWFGRWPLNKDMSDVKMHIEECTVTYDHGDWSTDVTWLVPEQINVQDFVVTSAPNVNETITTHVAPTAEKRYSVTVTGVAKSVRAACVASDAVKEHSVHYVCGGMEIKTRRQGDTYTCTASLAVA